MKEKKIQTIYAHEHVKQFYFFLYYANLTWDV